MNTYNSLFHNTLLRKHDKMREEFTKITNLMFGKVIADQNKFINNYSYELGSILNDPDYIISHSSGYITIASKVKFAHPTYKFSRDIASINLKENQMNFRRKGSPKVTKVIKFGRELTPAKAAKYIIQFGTK